MAAAATDDVATCITSCNNTDTDDAVLRCMPQCIALHGDTHLVFPEKIEIYIDIDMMEGRYATALMKELKGLATEFFTTQNLRQRCAERLCALASLPFPRRSVFVDYFHEMARVDEYPTGDVDVLHDFARSIRRVPRRTWTVHALLDAIIDDDERTTLQFCSLALSA